MPYTAHPVWMFPPNWTDGVVETLEWRSDVLASEVLAEQRISRRLTPRRSFQAMFLSEGRERQRFNSALSGKGADVWLVPVWHDVTTINAPATVGTDTLSVDTRWREYPIGGLVVIRGADSTKFEVGTVEAKTDSSLTLISNLEGSWPTGTKVYPALLMRLTFDINEIKRTDRLATVQVGFRVEGPTPHPTVFYPTDYRGIVVYDQRPDDSQELEVAHARTLLTFDDGCSRPLYRDLPGFQRTVSAYSWAFRGREAAFNHRQLLHYARGQAGALWVPSFMDDVTPASPIGRFDTDLLVENFGYSEFSARKPGREDLYIELKSGQKFCRRIVESAYEDEGVEWLTLDAPLFRDIAPHEILRISFLRLSRLNGDEVTIVHPTDTDGLTQCNVQWIAPVNAEPAYVLSTQYA